MGWRSGECLLLACLIMGMGFLLGVMEMELDSGDGCSKYTKLNLVYLVNILKPTKFTFYIV